MTEDQFPLYTQSITLPILAFPSWILCVAPMFWQLSQRNIAAGSLMLWMIFLNFFNSINPIIWPRDNMEDWYNGEGLCDIQVRIQVGAVVALAACAAVLARRLCNVMDTRNITIAPSRKSVIVERIIEIGCCWVYPAILMITYYVVQPFRYFLFGISGCVAAYDSSWPSLAVVWIWGCLTTLVAGFYAGMLLSSLVMASYTANISSQAYWCIGFITIAVNSTVSLLLEIPLNHVSCDSSPWLYSPQSFSYLILSSSSTNFLLRL